MHIVSGEFPEVSLLSNYTSHVRDSTKLSREPSAESFLTTGLWPLRSAGTPGWLESHQWQNTLWVSVFERKSRGLALSKCVELVLLLTNPTLDLVLPWWLSGKKKKNLPAMQEMRVQSLGQEDPLEVGMAIHSSVLAWTRQSHGQRSLVG